MLCPFLKNSWVPFYSTATESGREPATNFSLWLTEYKYNPVFPPNDNGNFYGFCPRASEQLVQPTVIQGQEYSFPSTSAGIYCVKVGLGNCVEILAVELLKSHRKLLWLDDASTLLQHEPPRYYKSLLRSKAVLVWLFLSGFLMNKCWHYLNNAFILKYKILKHISH